MREEGVALPLSSVKPAYKLRWTTAELVTGALASAVPPTVAAQDDGACTCCHYEETFLELFNETIRSIGNNRKRELAKKRKSAYPEGLRPPTLCYQWACDQPPWMCIDASTRKRAVLT